MEKYLGIINSKKWILWKGKLREIVKGINGLIAVYFK